MVTAARSAAVSASGRRVLSSARPLRPLCQICERHANQTSHTLRSRPTTSNTEFHTSATASDSLTQPYPRFWASKKWRSPAASAGIHFSRSSLAESPAAERPTSPTDSAPERELSSMTDMMTYLRNSTAKVLKSSGVPSEKDVAAALQACRVVADFIMDETVQPQIAHMIVESDSAASGLLSLDQTTPAAPPRPQRMTAAKAGSGRTNMLPPTPAEVAREQISAQVREMVDRISNAAYAVVAHAPVFITPSLLEDYVGVQARLGKPETLPNVFHMYASKPMASENGSSIQYTAQDPHSIKNAIEPKVIDQALDVAIAAKNLDAAVGIVENGYATKAYVRAKIARQALPPGAAFAATPVAAYALASNLSGLQSAMDAASATNVAFAGILAYVGFTASIGIVALTTANDQMKRVTWTPGVPLRKRWAREDQRAAMDKIACAWGFQETWRQGEEEGPQWRALQQFLGTKGMLLDRTDLMEGFD
ncbi:uncharacterized protein B0I36DRAFT_330678 [Microdochium trichocladiopsis]|uniref:Uncharacterized protein n=1 Tax=Microdochium trichocladiopsis TaxID=1682393 RepID=A0A9P8Y0B3_9PEZI|nr:uncharacterized protein B0I36DRAFT_330678 [Microdochium trichocladiopsis]KAH7026449.1 hypothetical protein B0I36DRAFT_330678 [Microdochium trichocladiopsis]